MLLSACVPLSPSLLTFQQTGIYQCQLFKTFSVSQPSCTFIQPVNYENLPCKKLYDFFKWLSSFSSVQLLSHVWLCDPMNCSMPGLPVITDSQSLLKLMSIESVMPLNHLILCCPLLLLPSIVPSIRSFQISQLFKRAQKTFKFFFELRMIGLLDT